MTVTQIDSNSTIDSTIAAHDSQIVFPNGLVGQPEWKRFVLLTPDDTTIQVLQTTENPELALMLTDPQQIVENYSVPLSAEERSVLQLDADEEPTFLCTVSIHNNLITTNLVGPIAFNGRTHVGTQVVLTDSVYSTRHPVAALSAQA